MGHRGEGGLMDALRGMGIGVGSLWRGEKMKGTREAGGVWELFKELWMELRAQRN